MFDADDPLDESEGPGQANLDLEEAGNGDQVDSALQLVPEMGLQRFH